MTRRPIRTGRQRGALLIMFAMMLTGILSFMGLALDVGQAYNRQAELQNLADAAALAAARSLAGSAAGIDLAAAAARSIAETHTVAYRQAVRWSDTALSFGASPTGPWHTLAAAQAAPQDMFYARVDTGGLDVAYSRVATVFMSVFDPAATEMRLAVRAVAGRSAIEVTPLAVCAMHPLAASARLNPGAPAISELVQYGFRRGVSYNLLNLNPAPGAATPEYFLVHPLGALGGAVAAGGGADATLAPFMCSGTLQLPRLEGQVVAVRRPAAFGLAGQLNSRFNLYGAGAGACLPGEAPPDTNIAQYSGAPVNWMASPDYPYAAPAAPAAGEPLATVADRPPGLPAPGAASYGPLWAFGPARQFAAPNLPIARAAWSTLYPAGGGAPAANANYGAAAPYSRSSAPQFLAPGAPGAPGRPARRLLNIPLLACPVPAGADAPAAVLAIGRFLLTSSASALQVSAEFTGLIAEASLGATAELVQ